MVNARTMRGLQAALQDCVPGRAQRRRLLEALARVPGNRTISAAMSALRARDDEMGPKRRDSAGPAPQPGSRFRAQVISYTQSPPEVQVTMPKQDAVELLRELEAEQPTSAHVEGLLRSPGPLGQLLRSLHLMLDGRPPCR